jgi:hypothetical protein
MLAEVYPQFAAKVFGITRGRPDAELPDALPVG